VHYFKGASPIPRQRISYGVEERVRKKSPHCDCVGDPVPTERALFNDSCSRHHPHNQGFGNSGNKKRLLIVETRIDAHEYVGPRWTVAADKRATGYIVF
jgi:hypothetical protein